MRWLMLAACLSGCAYKVRLESSPSGAALRLPNEEVITTPEVVRFRYVAFGHQRVTATAPGYRTLEVDLRRDEITFLHLARARLRLFRARGPERAAGRVELVLIPEHGPAGTWTPDGQDLE